MPERLLSSDYYVATLAMFAAIWGGLISYFRRVQSGEKHSVLAACTHIATSGFAGFLAWLACVGAEAPPAMTGLVCGLAGHMGVEFIKILELRFIKK